MENLKRRAALAFLWLVMICTVAGIYRINTLKDWLIYLAAIFVIYLMVKAAEILSN